MTVLEFGQLFFSKDVRYPVGGVVIQNHRDAVPWFYITQRNVFSANGVKRLVKAML
ncbi:hypothetical protein HMPREF3201_00322 [Megasphaera sp. MJR8396C]|nr:hypothetical protein HMPREF3201_00322 [Megasphaera sp. MJR8396C]